MAGTECCWKADDHGNHGQKIKIGSGEFDFAQEAVGFENGIHYIGLRQTYNNRKISTIFPDKDESIAVMLIPDSDDYLRGIMLLAMNREEKPDCQKSAEKYMN